MISLFYHPCYSTLELPDNHRFPIQKYQLLYQAIKQKLPEHFEFNQTIVPFDDYDALYQCHNKAYVDAFTRGLLDKKAVRKMGFPWSLELVSRTLISLNASYLAAKSALVNGISGQLSGGYHHAFGDYGSGFCIFNDLCVTASKLIKDGDCEKVLLLDLDVHQGDGSAAILQNRTDIITCSMHCEDNFPYQKQTSDYDLGLAKHTTDEAYLSQLNTWLTLIILTEQPDIILYNAGADIYQQDELGLMDVSLNGVFERDLQVMTLCKQHDIPLMTVSGGGYQRNVSALVEAHLQLYCAMSKVYG